MSNQAFSFLDPKFNPFMDPKNYAGFGEQTEKMFSMFDMGDNAVPGMKSIMDTQRRNIEALSQISQTAAKSAQDLTTRQAEIARKMATDAQATFQDLLAVRSVEEQISHNIDVVKRELDKQAEVVKEITEMMVSAQNEAGDIVKQRLDEAVEELKGTVKSASANPAKTKTTAKTA